MHYNKLRWVIVTNNFSFLKKTLKISMTLKRPLKISVILKRPLKISMVLKRPLKISMVFWGHHHHWMFFGTLTIDINGFSMVFGSPNHWFQWFSMVRDHWSNDGMVSMDRSGLIQTIFACLLAGDRNYIQLKLWKQEHQWYWGDTDPPTPPPHTILNTLTPR